ncbi:MAG: CCA tRNA nucleotidyltransferase [Bacilli bacterium]|nr:CCA tRNA nucleotidyltransferase [Bacilli bacterium]
MKLPNYVITAINLLERNGYEAYVVGGAVRDYLMGMTPHDFDLSTNATPIDVKKVFKSYFVIDTGIKHGTVSVMIDKHLLEITTYRFEEEYTDYRRPNEVHFIKNIKEDLIRRDFTINAICFNKDILDLVGGINDLNLKLIRAIGDPIKRFTEDPLRILRALRFSSVLDFKIEENTKTAIIKNFSLLEKVSKERINSEFSKILLGKNSKNILLEYKTLLEEYVLRTNINETNIIASTYLENDLILRLACLFIDFDYKEIEEKLLALKYPKKHIKKIVLIIENYNLDLNIDKLGIMKILKKVDYDIIDLIIKIKYAYLKVENQNSNILDSYAYIYKSLKSKYLKLKDLKINGKDLIEIGFKEGIEIKYVLEKLLDECISGLENEYEVLIKKAEEYRNEIYKT